MADLAIKTWIGFKEKTGDIYRFNIKILTEAAEVGNSKVQNGFAKMPSPAAVFITVEDALKGFYNFIAASAQYPYVVGESTWTAPEDLKLDMIKAIGIVSPQDYIDRSVFPWDIPAFISAIVDFLGLGTPSTPIPESVPDHSKDEVEDPDGTIFVPDKDQYYLVPEYIAGYSTVTGETRGYSDGAFVWDGIDISSEIPPHIWEAYTDFALWVERPYVFRPLTWRINKAPAVTRGFFNHYESSGSNYWLEQDRWKHISPTIPFVFYPEVDDDTGGGGVPATVQGVGLLGAFGLGDGVLGGLKPMTGIDIFKWLR